MEETDLPSLHALLSDPCVMEHLESPFSVEKTECFLKENGLSARPRVWAVGKDGCFAGYVIYHDYDAKSVEIGWVLLPEYWGRGYASLLTERMIERAEAERKDLVIECVPEQTVTRHIAEKYGFQRAGCSNGLVIFRRESSL